MTEQFVDFGSNLTGKFYLAKFGSTGAGTEIQGSISDFSQDGGERKREKINLLASNFAMVRKPSTLMQLKFTVYSNKNAVDFLELLNGTKSTTSGVDTITGESTEPSYYRLIYQCETFNASTGKTEARRWQWINVTGDATNIKIPSEDAIAFDLTLSTGLPNFTFKQTLDKDTHALPSITDYA